MSIPIQHLQKVDRTLGRAALFALQPLVHLRHEETERRILVIKFWGLGSLQLLSPALDALEAQYPGADIELLTLRSNVEFVEGLGRFARVHSVDLRGAGWWRVAWRLARMARALRRRRFAVVYDFEFFTCASAAFAVLSGAPQSHGFHAPKSGRNVRLHTHRTTFNRYWHVARNFRALAGGENGRPVAPDELSSFTVTARHSAELASLALESGFDSTGPLVVLNPNAGSLSLERRWPAERFGLLAARLVEEAGARIVLIGAPNERERVEAVLRVAGPLPSERVLDLSGRASLGVAIAALAAADVVVSNDSGPMHVAAALGTTTFGLFGPETPVMYEPLGIRTRTFYEPPSCSPCINVHDNKLSNCVKGFPECLTNISVSRVFAAVLEELDGRRILDPNLVEKP